MFPQHAADLLLLIRVHLRATQSVLTEFSLESCSELLTVSYRTLCDQC